MLERWVITAVLLAASHGATAWWFYGAGRDHEIAAQARETSVEQRATAAAASAAASAISDIEVRHVTVRQKVEREVQTREVFRECRSGPGVVRLLNTGAAQPAAEPAGDSKLPGASAPAR